ncbi:MULTISPECIES: helix-turn-helix domain-containing protein [Cupriavidus]|uniref:helix-turn-helix domain-containing protein n=1 Tax=Cupriavidus sp. DF5525 TaxID=3160989 RepID=UPI0032DEDD54
MDLLHAVGQAIRLAREHARLTQQQLSELSGVHVVSLSKIERGAAEARLLTLDALAQALQLSLSDLLRSAEVIQTLHPKKATRQ